MAMFYLNAKIIMANVMMNTKKTNPENASFPI
jgi:hypothetical protein